MIALGLAALSDASPQVLSEIRSLGFSGVDLQCDSDLPYMMYGAVEVAERLSESRLRVVCVSNVHDVERMCVGSQADRAEARDHALHTLDIACRLGVESVRLFFGCPDPSAISYRNLAGRDWSEVVEETILYSLPLFRRAAELGRTVLIEPHPRQSFYTLDDLDLLSDALRKEGLHYGVAFDPANVLAGGLDPVKYLRGMPPPMMVHLKDIEVSVDPRRPLGPGWKRYGPGPFMRFRGVGYGEIAWEAILSSLKQVQFDGPFIAEYEDVTIELSAAIRSSVLWASELGLVQTL